jgi:hypothetical protein
VHGVGAGCRSWPPYRPAARDFDFLGDLDPARWNADRRVRAATMRLEFSTTVCQETLAFRVQAS